MNSYREPAPLEPLTNEDIEEDMKMDENTRVVKMAQGLGAALFAILALIVGAVVTTSYFSHVADVAIAKETTKQVEANEAKAMWDHMGCAPATTPVGKKP